MSAKRFISLWALCCACGCASADRETNEGEVVGSQSEASSKNALTPREAATVLRLIDDRCGDTWCEGDYNFAFRRVTCSERSGSCTLTLQVFPREGVPASRKMYWRSCKSAGFTGYDSLVLSLDSGYSTLQEGYYAALTECISHIETRIE